MWMFFWRKIWRLFVLAVLVRVVRVAVRAWARRVETRNNGATPTSRALVWVGDALPQSGRRAGARA